MCGIAGFLGHFKPSLLDDFQQRLAHRGPDGYGLWHNMDAGKGSSAKGSSVYHDSGVGLAHRRLSIIDLSTAASQPMEAVGGRYTVVFNGEIYNFKSLVPELKAKGYAFNENSDTAVLCPLYDAYGPAMLDKLEGMFAFAIWDAKKGELFVARDHLGIKPIYYANCDKGLVFASELKVLRDIPGVDDSLDPVALAEYLTYLWTPSARTLVNGIRKLRPGHSMLARLDSKKGVRMEIERWYKPPLPPLADGRPIYDFSKTPAQLAEIFDFVVKEQSVADVPLGAFLSGGVDSSAIVASMAAQGIAPARAYCIGFGGAAGMASEGFGEDFAYARQVAEAHGIPLTEVRADANGILGRLPALAKLLDEPNADPAPLFVEDICLAARADGLKVLMSGTGGDDVMTGYRRHVTARLREYLGPLHGPVGNLMRLGAGAAGVLLGAPGRRRAERLAGLIRAREHDFLRLAFATNSQPDAWKLIAPHVRGSLTEGWNNDLTLAEQESAGQELVNRVLYAELFGFLPDHNLNYGDKAGMAAGVEIRVPFTDRRLLSFMADVPPASKLRFLNAKAFFKESQRGRVPDSILNRSKTGFGAPVRVWLAGEGRSMVEETLFGPNSPAADWFDSAAVKAFWRQTLNGDVDGAYTILALCMACWWKQN